MTQGDVATNPYEVRSLARGLRILENVAATQTPQRLTDIATAMGVDRATAYRYCSTLTKLGYLHADPIAKVYSLGSQVRVLGFAAQSQWSWLAVVEKHLPLVADTFGGAASFAVLEGDEILYLDRAVAEQALNQNISVGDRMPAGRTSIGKVLLAEFDDGDVRQTLRGAMTRPEVSRLIQDLQVVRRQGWAANLGGMHPGLHSVAVAVRDADSGAVLGGLNVAGAADEMPVERLAEEIVPELLQTAELIGAGKEPIT